MRPFSTEPSPAEVEAIARGTALFESVSLPELGGVTLMDRVDTKFLVPAACLAELAHRLPSSYRVLEIDGRRSFRYTTRYFDTPELDLYHAHHAGRTPRVKVRVRAYDSTGDRFLEVKVKTNKGRTRKVRVSLGEGSADPLERLEEEGYLGLASELAPLDLHPAAVVGYRRTTLVARDASERLTLDMELTFSRGDEVRSFPGVVIAEVKQDRRGPSVFREAMRRMGVREGALSKYCLGIALLDPTAKRNRFKSVLRRLERLGEVALAVEPGLAEPVIETLPTAALASARRG